MSAVDFLGTLHAAGLLTTEELTKVAERHEDIRPELDRQVKIASFLQNNPIAGAAVAGAAGVGGAALASFLADAADSGLRSLKDSVTKAQDYKAMLGANPQLKDYDQKKVHRAFHVMRKLMPDLSKDPVIAGEWVKQLAMREAYGTDTLKSMMDAQGSFSKNQPRADSQLAAIMSGAVGAGANEMAKSYGSYQIGRTGLGPKPERGMSAADKPVQRPGQSQGHGSHGNP